MMNTVKKEKIEELCIYYLDSMDVSDAAMRAGLEGDPLVTGTRLLSTRSAKRILKRLTDGELTYTRAIAGLMKLAIGNRSQGADVASTVDGYALTDIKKGKDGVGECKLVNRLDALKLLLEVCRTDTSNGAENFFKALNGMRADSFGDNDE